MTMPATEPTGPPAKAPIVPPVIAPAMPVLDGCHNRWGDSCSASSGFMAARPVVVWCALILPRKLTPACVSALPDPVKRDADRLRPDVPSTRAFQPPDPRPLLPGPF